jgi:carbohydrate diacid regulator
MTAGMLITPDLAAPIVERAMAILHRNVNIMNAEGIIVGSGDPSRVGSFHTGAAAVLRKDRRVEIHPADAPQWPGVRPGVNLPLRVGGQIVGVVGITGAPDEVRPYGELLREMVQLMLIQARTAELELAAAVAREACLRDLLTGTGELPERLVREARLTGLNDQAIYRVIVCEPPRTSESGNYDWVESLVARAEQAAAAVDVAPFLVTGPWDGRLVMVAGDPAGALAGLLYQACGTESIVAEGLAQPGIHGLRRSYHTALLALTAGCRLTGAGVFSAEALRMETMLAAIAPEEGIAFSQSVAGRLPPAGSRQGEVLRQTLNAFLRSGMSQSGAADLLGIHRHTLTYRLAQVQEATDHDPRTWDGAVQLYLALVLERLFGQDVQTRS